MLRQCLTQLPLHQAVLSELGQFSKENDEGEDERGDEGGDEGADEDEGEDDGEGDFETEDLEAIYGRAADGNEADVKQPLKKSRTRIQWETIGEADNLEGAKEFLKAKNVGKGTPKKNKGTPTGVFNFNWFNVFDLLFLYFLFCLFETPYYVLLVSLFSAHLKLLKCDGCWRAKPKTSCKDGPFLIQEGRPHAAHDSENAPRTTGLPLVRLSAFFCVKGLHRWRYVSSRIEFVKILSRSYHTESDAQHASGFVRHCLRKQFFYQRQHKFLTDPKASTPSR